MPDGTTSRGPNSWVERALDGARLFRAEGCLDGALPPYPGTMLKPIGGGACEPALDVARLPMAGEFLFEALPLGSGLRLSSRAPGTAGAYLEAESLATNFLSSSGSISKANLRPRW